MEFGSVERDLRVGPIEPAGVSARGEQARLAVCGSAVVGGLTVVLRAVNGRTVAL